MCVVLELDLVFPAIVMDELMLVKELANKKDVKNPLNIMTISSSHIMSFSRHIKTLDLGRVVINFTEEDARNYLLYKQDIFNKFKDTEIFTISHEWSILDIENWLNDKIIHLNYPEKVLRTLNLNI